MSLVSRRTILSAGGLGLLTALAGCQTLSTRRQRERYAVDLENYSTESRSFTVRIVDETGERIGGYDGDIGAGKQVVRVFTGTPTTMHARIGDHPEVVFAWPTPSCVGGSPAPKAELSHGMANSVDETRVFGRCEAIPAE